VNELNNQFEKFERRRKELKLSRREVSELTGLTEQCIRNIEKGDRSNPSIASVVKLAKCYQISLDEYFNIFTNASN